MALFFNMNRVWEAYLLRTLQRLAPPAWTVSKPPKVVFWQAKNGQQSRMQPDILLEHPAHGCLVLDAKWKRPTNRHAENDLRQLFAYAHHFGATQVRLLYPQAGQGAAVEGAFTRGLVVADIARTTLENGHQKTISCGISYLQVGAQANEAGLHDSDTDAAGYLYCTLTTELAGWLRTACQKTQARAFESEARAYACQVSYS